MLSCRGLATIASDYIDDELGTVNKMSVRMHLLMCPHCRSFIGSLRSTTEVLKLHSEVEVRESYIQRVEQEVQQALERRRSDPRP
ncbi:MAG: zf-HC2 domain-containing protein [Marinobacter sp.]|uniref:zf-HC2 domain-containing protein n=1 Tax=Marinobacter sp. TaxID=50741 RepID=UPI00299EED19|nr:zf-HC2 domain-containing protein [Marinobacter sp.]MDX1635530.1 zf-HC2 domain-containing protein [Marinobacter sp.]